MFIWFFWGQLRNCSDEKEHSNCYKNYAFIYHCNTILKYSWLTVMIIAKETKLWLEEQDNVKQCLVAIPSNTAGVHGYVSVNTPLDQLTAETKPAMNAIYSGSRCVHIKIDYWVRLT
jgi:hypothetical protein